MIRYERERFRTLQHVSDLLWVGQVGCCEVASELFLGHRKTVFKNLPDRVLQIGHGSTSLPKDVHYCFHFNRTDLKLLMSLSIFVHAPLNTDPPSLLVGLGLDLL